MTGFERLRASEERRRHMRQLTSEALIRIAAMRVDPAVSLLEAAVERAKAIEVVFGADEAALDQAVSALSVVFYRLRKDERYRDQRARVRELLSLAVRLRLRGLTGEMEQDA